MANGNGNGRKIGWVQVMIACIATAASVFFLVNSSKVSIDSMKEYQKNEDDFRRTVDRRLSFLESADQKLSDKLDKHLEADRGEFGDMDKRIRDTEIMLAKIGSRIRVSKTFKPLMPNLHEVLRVRVPTMTSYERPKIGGIE